MMLNKLKTARKAQRMRSAYHKLKKKLCKPCLKGLSLSTLQSEEATNFDFCDVCEPLTKEVYKLQSEMGDDANKEIIDNFNEAKKNE